jgi:hypothetical protein
MEQKIRTNAIELNSKIIIIQYYGGGNGLLKNEIQSTLEDFDK